MSSAGHIFDMIKRMKNNDLLRRSRANYRVPKDGIIRISDSNEAVKNITLSEERRKAIAAEFQQALKVRRIKLGIGFAVVLAFVTWLMLYFDMLWAFYG